MTTFKTFLIEKVNQDGQLKIYLDEIFKECQPYISANLASLRKGKTLIRATHNKQRDDNYNIEKKSIRTDRLPRDTALPLHQVADEHFYNRFGKRYRSAALFCQASDKSRTFYGDYQYMIFPISEYTLCFSAKTKDLAIALDPSINDKAGKSVVKRCSAKVSSLFSGKNKNAAAMVLYNLCLLFFAATTNSTRIRNFTPEQSIDRFLDLYEDTFTYRYKIEDYVAILFDLDLGGDGADDYRKFIMQDFSVILNKLGFSTIDEIQKFAKSAFDDVMKNIDYTETKTIAEVPGISEIMVAGKEYYSIPFELKSALTLYFKEMK